MFLNLIMSKPALLFGYIFSYYFIMFFIVSVFFLLNISNINFLSELNFYSNNAFTHMALSVAYISLAGLPPLFFFFPNFTLIASVVLQGSWLLSTALLVLIFFGWFLYLTAVNLLSNQSWSHSSVNVFQNTHVNTLLGVTVIFSFWFLIFGWFFIDDFYVFMFWLFLA